MCPTDIKPKDTERLNSSWVVKVKYLLPLSEHILSLLLVLFLHYTGYPKSNSTVNFNIKNSYLCKFYCYKKAECVDSAQWALCYVIGLSHYV